jgi:hypothetical protein
MKKLFEELVLTQGCIKTVLQPEKSHHSK